MIKIKLSAFDFIDEVIEYKHKNIEIFEESSLEIVDFFKSMFQNQEESRDVTYRIKTDESLMEKIIRQNYAKRFSDAQAFFAYLSDLIGVRISCRFIDDEKRIYDFLVDEFKIEKKNGYYASELNQDILLKLSEKQPGKQKNGFEIYKIDGILVNKEIIVNFELQIKSMVNLFWGEIDHNILYKNYNYVITEDFIRQIMYSIKEGLMMIDNQMQIVSKRMESEEDAYVDSRKYMKSVVTKVIHDNYTKKLRDDMNLNINFRTPSNVIADYIFYRVKDGSREEFATEFIKTLDVAFEQDCPSRFGNIINIGEISFVNEKSKKIALKIVEVMNQDLIWNMMISIIYELNGKKSMEEEISHFAFFLYLTIIETIEEEIKEAQVSDKIKEYMVDKMTDIFIENFLNDFQISYFSYNTRDNLSKETRNICKRLNKGERKEKLIKEFSKNFKEHIRNED